MHDRRLETDRQGRLEQVIDYILIGGGRCTAAGVLSR